MKQIKVIIAENVLSRLKNAHVFSKPISPWIIGLIKIIYKAINNDPKNIEPKNLVIVAAEWSTPYWFKKDLVETIHLYP